MKYNWQQKDWPNFSFDISGVEDLLLEYLQNAGRLRGLVEAMPEAEQTETILQFLIEEAIKTSEIEGEFLSRHDVASSIRRNLGIADNNAPVGDLRAKGIAELATDVRKTYNQALTEEKILEWHKSLMSYSKNIAVGCWRAHDEPMQIVSGPMGREKVHFEAPPSHQVPAEMSRFVRWFNQTSPQGEISIKHAAVRAFIAHLYFESIHPFEDGNGRIGRAIAEKALAQSTGFPQLLSISSTIAKDKKEYYLALEKAQRSNEITDWLSYFVAIVIKAQHSASALIEFTLAKTRFFDRFKNQLNVRQLKVVARMFEEGSEGFEGGMNASKYMRIAKTSKATATRDLQNLLEIGALSVTGKGRNTRYNISA